MPTVIDSFVLEFGLDPSKFTEGQRALLDSLKNTQDEVRRRGGEIESTAKQTQQFFLDLKRTTLGMVGIFLGGMGIKEFTGYITNLDAATGRLAKTMDLSAEELSTWQGAAKQMGGTAEGITGTLQNLSSEANKFSLTGQSGMLGVLTQLGVGFYNANGQIKTSTELFLDLADAVQGMDPAKARAMLSMLGMDQNAINMAIQGRRALQDYLDAARRAGTATKESVATAQEYQKQIGLLDTAATNLGRTIFNWAAPGLIKVIDKLNDLFGRLNATPEERARNEAEGRKKMTDTLGDPEDYTVTRWLRKTYMLNHLGHDEYERLEKNPAEFNKKYHEMFDENPASKPPAATSPATPAPPTSDIPVKPGAGRESEQVRGVLDALAGVPGIKEVTSMDDSYHERFPSAHSRGMAVDVTLKDPSKSAEAAEMIKSILADKNITVTVLDEYKSPSAHATGGHLHIGIVPTKAAAAVRVPQIISAPSKDVFVQGAPPLQPNFPQIGAPAAAAVQHSTMIDNSRTQGDVGGDRSTKIDIGEVNISVPGGDANKIASSIEPALRRQAAIASWNTGLA